MLFRLLAKRRIFRNSFHFFTPTDRLSAEQKRAKKNCKAIQTTLNIQGQILQKAQRKKTTVTDAPNSSVYLLRKLLTPPPVERLFTSVTAIRSVPLSSEEKKHYSQTYEVDIKCEWSQNKSGHVLELKLSDKPSVIEHTRKKIFDACQKVVSNLPKNE